VSEFTIGISIAKTGGKYRKKNLRGVVFFVDYV
jgi:hypothetical protein